MKERLLPSENPLPLVIEPSDSNRDVVAWAAANRAHLDERLVTHGALLFRGFDIQTPESFEPLASTLMTGLYNENGEHPRESISGNVYTTVFYPPEEHLLWHNENSFNHRWPLHIMFCCARAPSQGGETPLADSREVYRRLDPEIRDRFERQGVMYMRNYGDGLGLTWHQVFQTQDRAEVEAVCAADRFEVEWKDGNRLRTRCVRPAVIPHPVTGEPCWFTQAQHWHVSCLRPEVREALTALFPEDDLPRNCYYGDGSPIEDAVMDAILDVYRDVEVVFPWETGDVAIVDNVLTAHARNAFQGDRSILVSMGDMTAFS